MDPKGEWDVANGSVLAVLNTECGANGGETGCGGENAPVACG